MPRHTRLGGEVGASARSAGRAPQPVDLNEPWAVGRRFRRTVVETGTDANPSASVTVSVRVYSPGLEKFVRAGGLAPVWESTPSCHLHE